MFLAAGDGQAPPASSAPVLHVVKPRAAVDTRGWSQLAWDRRGAPAETVTHEEHNADGADGFAAASEDGTVRLSSQDLCGFLMRLA
jgi:hypothetical protein